MSINARLMDCGNVLQVYDTVTAFIKLFCKPAKIHERRAQKSGKSTAYYQVGVHIEVIARDE